MDRSPSPGSRSSSAADDVLARLTSLIHSSRLAPLVSALAELGEVYLVGGAVRDCLAGREPHDLDLAIRTDSEVALVALERAGFRVIPTGRRHGTLTVVHGNEHVEVTTFRTLLDGRRTESIEADLEGRDFTINAMAFAAGENRLVDPFDGAADSSHGIVRGVADPSARFEEDPLRILRMIRFGPASGRQVDKATGDAARSLGAKLGSVSPERIRSELERILMSSHPAEGIDSLRAYGLLPYTIPELGPSVGFEQNEFHVHDVFDHTLWVISRTRPSLELRLAALFHDAGKPATLSVDDAGRRHFYQHENVSESLCRERMEALRFSNQATDDVAKLVRLHMRPLECGPAGVRRLMRDLGPLMETWLALKRADSPPKMPAEELEERIASFTDLVDTERKRLNNDDRIRLAISGGDLLELGFREGPIVGSVLRALEELVIEDPALNQPESLRALAKQRLI